MRVAQSFTNLLFASLCGIFSLGNVFAAEPNPSRDERWRSDLQFMAEELPKLHPNLFFQTTKENFEKEITELSGAIPVKKDYEITTEMMRIAASVGDAHTNIFPWESGIYRRYPVQLYWFRDGIFVTGTTKENPDLLGAKLTKIGGKNISEICEKIRPLIAHENEARVKATAGALLVTPEVLQSVGAVIDMEAVNFSFEKDGASFEKNFSPISRSQQTAWISVLGNLGKNIPLYLQNQRESYWFTYLEDSKTLYVQYNNCKNEENFPFEEFTTEFNKFVAENKIDRCVLDLRLNAGGSSYVALPLVKAIAQNNEINRDGKFFVAVGRKTFSAAILNSVQLQATTKAIFVGEPTGGKPNHFGETKEFRLPNSGYVVSYSTKYLAPSKSEANTLVPDILVETNSSDYFSGRDPVLEAVLGYQVASK